MNDEARQNGQRHGQVATTSKDILADKDIDYLFKQRSKKLSKH